MEGVAVTSGVLLGVSEGATVGVTSGTLRLQAASKAAIKLKINCRRTVFSLHCLL
jgi:hypothetical protein